jgi:hypothetical protein
MMPYALAPHLRNEDASQGQSRRLRVMRAIPHGIGVMGSTSSSRRMIAGWISRIECVAMVLPHRDHRGHRISARCKSSSQRPYAPYDPHVLPVGSCDVDKSQEWEA